jgi:mono/diheme cytochrome c family protein
MPIRHFNRSKKLMKTALRVIAILGWVVFAESCSGVAQAQEADPVKLHLQSHAQEYEWFNHAANGFDGVPYLLLRLLPELEPEIWGVPTDRFSRFGFRSTQNDQTRPLPTGLAWDPLIPRPDPNGTLLHKVTLTCSACHTGYVRTRDGVRELVGAPNTQIDVRAWRRAFELTVAKRMSTPEKIQDLATAINALIDTKEATCFYSGQSGVDAALETEQRNRFKNNLVAELADFARKVQGGKLAVDLQRLTSYSKDNRPPLNGHTPGQSDGTGDLVPKLLLLDDLIAARGAPDPRQATISALSEFLSKPRPALRPENATATDILSTWYQKRHTVSQIDGSVKSPFFRNIAAILAVAGSPMQVNAHNADFSAKFLSELPPPAYPFPIGKEAAERGKQLFQKHCSVCHHDGNQQAYASLRTDPNRARVLNQATVELLLRHFRASVPAGFTYKDPQGNTIDPHQLGIDEVVNANRAQPEHQGYVTDGLEGLWARAPYLHNGSVPTLRHLLTGSTNRPKRFVRGSIDYDAVFVGWMWRESELSQLRETDSMATLYDTQWDGCSNAGHDTDIMVEGEIRKLDWNDDPDGLHDLLEYLKTF